MQLGIEQQDDWAWQWRFHSLVLEKRDKILDNRHALFIEMSAGNVCSDHGFLLIDRLVKFHHFLHILRVKNQLGSCTVFAAILSHCHWETVGNVDNFSINSAQQGADDHAGLVAVKFLFLRVLQQVWHDLGLDDAMLLLGSRHAKVQIGFDFV